MGKDQQEIAPIFTKIYNSNRSIYAKGTFKAEIGKGIISHLFAGIIGLHNTNKEQNIDLCIVRKNGKEYWERNFNGRKFKTRFFRFENSLIELFLSTKIWLKPQYFHNTLVLESFKITLGAIKLPLLFKIISTDKSINEHEWSFDVRVLSKKSNLILRYYGKVKILEP